MNTYLEPQPCSSKETKPSLSSLKIYFVTRREYISSGTFVKLQGCGSLVFEIISVVEDQAEESPPPDIMTRSSLVTSCQKIKLGVYKICTERHHQQYWITPYDNKHWMEWLKFSKQISLHLLLIWTLRQFASFSIQKLYCLVKISALVLIMHIKSDMR